MKLPDIKKRSPTEKKEKKSFLKKLAKKQVIEVKQISQKRMDIIFWTGFVGIVALCVVTVVLSFTREMRPVVVQQAEVVEIDPNEVDYRLQEFLGNYIDAYFNLSEKSEEARTQSEYLNTFYNFVPDVVNPSVSRKAMRLISYRPVEIKNGMASYRVTYEIGSNEEVKKVTVLFTIPFGGKDGSYYVLGLPNYRPVADYRAESVDEREKLKLSASDNLSEENKSELDAFIELFFTNYTTSQENLDVISNGITTIKGVGFSSLDYSYYDIDDDKVSAYVQVTFDILGHQHPENFSLTMEKRGKNYFVTNLEYTIPVEYVE